MNPKLKPVAVILAANVLFIAAKLFVALYTGSLAVLATLFDSVLDLLAGLFAYLGIREASKPADEEHHYGHYKYEHLSSLAQLALVVVSAGFIVYQALKEILSPHPLELTALEVGVLAGTIVIDIFLVRYLKANIRKFQSVALEATGTHYYADVLQNSVALIGVVMASAGFPLADPIAALGVAYLILKPVYQVGLKSMRELSDSSPPQETLSRMEEAILSVRGIKGFERLRCRLVGGKIYLDVAVQVDGRMSLNRAHVLSHKVIGALRKKIPEIQDAVVHAKPEEKEHAHH